jgi:hypothetical protein
MISGRSINMFQQNRKIVEFKISFLDLPTGFCYGKWNEMYDAERFPVSNSSASAYHWKTG